MLTLEFGLEDLAQVRFAISPMAETVFALRLCLHPDRAGPHRPWLPRAMADADAAGVDLAPVRLAIPGPGYLPDFLTPPATSPGARFSDELARVRATPGPVVRKEIEHAYRSRRPPKTLGALLAEPRRAARRLADTVEGFWSAVLEPRWPRVQALLDADVAHRARRLTEAGAAGLLGELHPQVRRRGETLEVATALDARVALTGRGLLLVPTVFFWHGVAPIIYPPWQSTLIYPARGLELLWDEATPRPEALAGVLGTTRAALLTELDRPRSTTALAAALGLSTPAISHQLSALRAAALVGSGRYGREVLYLRTELAERLLTATRA